MGLFNKKSSVQFTVANMNCGHCEAKITGLVEGIDGVAKVKADSGSKQLEIWYTGETPTVEQVNQVLADTDYRAQA